MGRTLENYCLRREEGGFVRKVPACTKNDLCCMIRYLYTNVNTLSDYQDASLLCMMWFMFGRASDLSFVQKQNISIDAGGIFFVGLIRLKTSEEQGLSLFPDSEPLMGPLFTMAVALMTQVALCADLLDNLPPTIDTRSTLWQLQNCTTVDAAHPRQSLLDRVPKEAGVKLQLTLHSFRRGGAHIANGSEHLTARWIFDRGAWNVSTTNKGFGYVFNTLKEDHKVAKVLSGHSPSERVKLVDLSPFDSATRQKIGQMQRLVFSACSGLITRKYNVEGDVLEVLIAYLILHYPLLKDLNPNGLAAIRLEACLTQAGCTIPELLAWSAHLATTMANPSERTTIDDSTSNIETCERQIIRHQASVIDNFIQHSKRQDDRIDALEKMLFAQTQSTIRNDEVQASQVVAPTSVVTPQDATKCRRQSSIVPVKSVWFKWYTLEPRLWIKSENKQKRSDSKMLVAYLKLFLDAGFTLDESATTYRDEVMTLGLIVEERVSKFLSQHGSKSKGANAVLKKMRSLHRTGKLNDRIATYRRLLSAGSIIDPSPSYTQDVLVTHSQ
ncbi:hypothetical protein Ae201684P_007152 [Aphanomyces euteiches]|nr:hypothetical protein Ae201684P_007152 [Aphanomyces euteiches]